MSTSTPCDPKSPLMIAWTAYKATDEYRNTFKWAEQEQHRDGSLWAAFEQGFRRSIDAQPPAASPSPQAWRPSDESVRKLSWILARETRRLLSKQLARQDEAQMAELFYAWVSSWSQDPSSPDLPAPGWKENA